MSGSHRHEVERLAPADQAAGEGKCAAQQSRGVAEGAEQVSPRLRGLFPSAPGSSLQRRVDRVAGDANKTAKTVNASEPAADPVLFRPRVALAGDWLLPRRELGLKGLGSGQKFTSESLEIVRHPAIRFGAGQAKVSFCPQAQICRVLHGGNSLMRGLSPRRNLSQLPLARAPLCAAGCSIFERRHSCIGM